MRAYKVARKTGLGKYESWSPIGYSHLYYEIGKRTEAHPGSVGIICFDSIELARQYDELCKGRVILVVQGHGKPIRPISLRGNGDAIPEGKWWEKEDSIFNAPPRTICFPSVTVIKRLT